MAVRIRIVRIGKTNHPSYRLGVYDSHNPRNGTCLENLGWYNPLAEDEKQQLSIDAERTQHWLSVGALPTPKAHILLKKAGVKFPQRKVKSQKEKKEALKKESKKNQTKKDKKEKK